MHRVESDIKNSLYEHDEIIVIGQTGSGKSTVLPQFIYDVVSNNGRMSAKVLVTQPRRFAVDSLTDFVGLQIGKENVGKRYKGTNTVSPTTKIDFMVTGSLLNMLQEGIKNGTLLEEYSKENIAILFDEAHKESTDGQLTLALFKKVQELRRQKRMKPIKFVLASGTVDEKKLRQYFPKAVVHNVEGRMHSITDHFAEKEIPYEEAPKEAARVAADILADTTKDGNILIFMPGRSDIAATARSFQEELRMKEDVPDKEKIKVITLTGGTRDNKQKQEMERITDEDRVVFISTNVGQESATFQNLKHVIDSGWEKVSRYDDRTGLTSLRLTEHTKADWRQRAGRAGRVAPGDGWYLFTKAQAEARADFPEAEVFHVDLTSLVLRIKNIGIDNVYEFDYPDHPGKDRLDTAVNTLKKLGALDAGGAITDMGKEMAELPVDPHYARMLVEAKKRKTTNAVSVLVGFLSSQRSVFDFNPRTSRFDQKYAQFLSRDSDYITLLRVWNGYVQNRDRAVDWCKSNGLNYSVLKEVEQTKNDFIDEEGAQSFGIEERDVVFDVANNELLVEIQKCVIAGFVDRLLKHTGRGEYAMEYGPIRGIKIGNRSALLGKNHQYVVADTIAVRGRRDRPVLTIAETCQMVKNEWIREVAPQIFPKTSETPKEEQIQKQQAENNLYGRDAAVHHSTETERTQREQQISRSETATAKPTLWGRIKRFFGSFFGS